MWEYNYSRSPELYHHGIKGQKWGIRRYQNEDGTLTPEGARRYGPANYLKPSDAAYGIRLRDMKRANREIKKQIKEDFRDSSESNKDIRKLYRKAQSTNKGIYYLSQTRMKDYLKNTRGLNPIMTGASATLLGVSIADLVANGKSPQRIVNVGVNAFGTLMGVHNIVTREIDKQAIRDGEEYIRRYYKE